MNLEMKILLLMGLGNKKWMEQLSGVLHYFGKDGEMSTFMN